MALHGTVQYLHFRILKLPLNINEIQLTTLHLKFSTCSQLLKVKDFVRFARPTLDGLSHSGIWMVDPKNHKAKLRYPAKHLSFSWDTTSMTHSSNYVCTAIQEPTQLDFKTLDEN